MSRIRRFFGAGFLILSLGLTMAISSEARASTLIGTMADATVTIGTIGASTSSQTINGILFTEGQIGVMADRILWTETQIGEMSNRIVYVTQLSQNNIVAMYVYSPIFFTGMQNGLYTYSGVLTQVTGLPFGW
jgi:hypothetical protein